MKDEIVPKNPYVNTPQYSNYKVEPFEQATTVISNQKLPAVSREEIEILKLENDLLKIQLETLRVEFMTLKTQLRIL